MSTQQIYEHVTERYSAASRGTALEYGASVAKAFGYSEEELADIPKESNLGLSCGNPTAMASLREGETVIDLGSGAGFDVFLAANKVGPSGKVIGVDMNKASRTGQVSLAVCSIWTIPADPIGQDMLARANEIKAKHNKTNVSFVDAQITDMSAIPSGTADCIISNCVINLVPEEDKPLVFNEMHRLLKPGGRVAVSDILAKRALPEKLRANMALYVGCVAGASLVEQYERYLAEAGFEPGRVVIRDDGADLNVYLETNPDGTRTVGGTGGNLCCNPSIPSAPSAAPSASSSCVCCPSKPGAQQPAPVSSSSSCCSGDKKSAPAVAPASSSCSGGKSKTDAVMESAAAAAAAAAAASSSSSCCGGGSKPGQSYAFDEKDLADLEGENLNELAGSYKIYAVKS
ncbi:arsenite S-adenosylmethyltransferase [Diaporthe helianthi]|uniref:Arsenite methyltransferase n=1 Tax=Diaporthe helianthi TaxID=158607 RepID=A0A2P5I2S0_DIAHE|nr:arsenite S-adenosylmethyltransferase [Diaporthe helianthi]